MIAYRNNLAFEVVSPSYWRLAGMPEGVTVDVSYIDNGEWCLCVDDRGAVLCEIYTRRDDAMAQIRAAFSLSATRTDA